MDRSLHSKTAASVAFAAIALIALFVSNARWGASANVDVVATAFPAWNLVERSSLRLSDFPEENPWFVEDRTGHTVSNRAPGLIATGLPGYLLIRTNKFSNTPATMVALVSTLAAVGIVIWMTKPLVGGQAALASGVVFAVGTTTWAVSSAQLWPHGPGQLAAMLTLSGFAASRYLSAGAATAWAVTMRPISAVYAAVLGLIESWKQRSWRPVIRFGTVSAVGLVVVLAYNRWLFGQWSLVGGSANLAGGFGDSFSVAWYLQNLVTMFFSLNHGLIVLSPIVLVASVGVIKSWQSIPQWARSAALAGLAYLLAHAAFNRASGGGQVFYRYPLEALALASVALTIGATYLYRASRAGRIAVTSTAAISIVIQVVNVFVISCVAANPNTLACQL